MLHDCPKSLLRPRQSKKDWQASGSATDCRPGRIAKGTDEMPEDLLVQRYGRPRSAPDASTAAALDHPGLANLLQRRVIRDYLDQPVDIALLDLLLDAAFSAPSKSDS